MEETDIPVEELLDLGASKVTLNLELKIHIPLRTVEAPFVGDPSRERVIPPEDIQEVLESWSHSENVDIVGDHLVVDRATKVKDVE